RRRRRLPRPLSPPGEKPLVLEARLAVGERGAVERGDRAAGGFEHRLAGGGVPLHRRAEARVEIGLAGGEHAEFEGAAADAPLLDRAALEILGEAAAVFVAAAVDHDNPAGGRHPRRDRLELAAPAAAPG